MTRPISSPATDQPTMPSCHDQPTRRLLLFNRVNIFTALLLAANIDSSPPPPPPSSLTLNDMLSVVGLQWFLLLDNRCLMNYATNTLTTDSLGIERQYLHIVYIYMYVYCAVE